MIVELHCRLVEPLSGTNLPPYLLLFFDQRQICDVRANLNSKRDRQVDNKLGKNANWKVFWNRQYWNLLNKITGQVVVITAFRWAILNVYNRFFGQTCPQNIAKSNWKRFAMGTRNCLSCMFGSKSCHIRVAIDTAAEITLFRPTFSSACADTTFDEWTYARVFIHIHFLERFPNQCVWVNTLSLSRVDTVWRHNF